MQVRDGRPGGVGGQPVASWGNRSLQSGDRQEGVYRVDVFASTGILEIHKKRNAPGSRDDVGEHPGARLPDLIEHSYWGWR